MPAMPELYMHRIGRTGRADKTGTAISFIAPREEEAKVEIEVLMNMELAIDRSTEVEVSAKLIEPEKSDKSLSF
jgi:ATP-dependent RNA helicase RhlE